ncbi:MAG: Na+/H+ antiporter [Rhodospirillales bacterium]|nr:Na+/H+ antiporter [Rhodospirillales bacterium]
MAVLEVVLAMLAVAIVLAHFSDRLRIPYAVLLVIAGMALAFAPRLPKFEFDPQIVLALFLPPLLFSAAYFTSWRDFRFYLRPILLLAIGLVLATTLGVGVAFKLLVPDVPWAVAFLLGAIVSPPDAVAAAAIMEKLRLPKRIVAILEGESLVNDATGLVLYKFALAAALSGTFSAVEAAGAFVAYAVGGCLLGFLGGLAAVQIMKKLHETLLQISFTFVVPYVAFLVGEHVHVSGVLVVVVAGLVIGWHAPEMFSAQARVQGQMVWSAVIFVLNALVFILIGLQLDDILVRLADYSWGQLIWWAVAISVVAIVIRLIWVFPNAYIPTLFRSVREREGVPPKSWTLIVGWTGMRGVVSLAAALAIPVMAEFGEPFPARDLVIFLSFSVIFATLVIQGTTLAPLIRFLRVGGDRDAEKEEEVARRKLTHAALAEIDRLAEIDFIALEIAPGLRRSYQNRLKPEEMTQEHIELEHARRHARRVRLEVVNAERRRLLKLRREREIGDDVLHKLMREVDLEEMRLAALGLD